MPEFPRQHSKAALTTSQPRAFRDDADIRTDVADRSKIINKGMSDVTDTATKWKASVEKIQGNTAMYNFKVGMLEINAGAAQDTDINNEGKWQQQVQDLRKKVIKGIDPYVANQLNPELDYMASVGRIGLQGEFQKKTVIAGQAVTMGELDLISNTPTNPKNDALRIKAELDKAKATGLYNDVQIQKLQTTYDDKAQQNGFRQDARNDRELAKKRVEEGYYGFDQKQTDTALSTLEHYKNLENKEETQRIVDGRFDLFQALASGKEDLYGLSSMAQDFVNSDVDTAEAIGKAQKAAAGYYTSKADRSFVTTIREASEATSQDKLTNIMYSALYRDKNVTPERLGALAYYCSERAKTLKLSKTDVTWSDAQTDPKQFKTDLCLNALSDWAKANNIDKEEHANLITELITKTSEDQNPLPYYQEMVKRENLKILPDMANFSDDGQLMVDDKGVAFTGYPDGRVAPIVPKITKLPEGETEKKTEKSDSGMLSFDEANK